MQLYVFFKFSIHLSLKFFILPTKNISPDACFRFFIYLPAIFLGVSPWKIVGKYCGKSKASTVCKDIQWQAVKLTFFAT